MTDQGFTLPVLYVRHIADQLRSMGADVAGWLSQSGLDEARLDDPSLVIDYPLFRQLSLDAQVVSREPALGLLVGERLTATTHGVVGYAALSSGTIRQALELLERYARLRLSLLAITHEVKGDRARVWFREAVPLFDMQRPVLEAVMLSIKNVLDAISMGACRVSEAWFPFEAPGYARLATELFGCPVVYGKPAACIALPSAVLDAPLKLADPEAFREAAALCQRELDKLTASETMSSRVRRILLEKQHGFPSLELTARLCHMTPRTLHRRLCDEGTSYRALLEEVRSTLALEHVRSGRLSIEEIAYTLGYTDMANFRRAFKRWQGVPPSRVERREGSVRAPAGARPRERR